MSIYRFPPFADPPLRPTEQIAKIEREVMEAYRELQPFGEVGNRRNAYGMELLDIIHATETALRMEFTEAEVDELRQKVIAKNEQRGYYEAVD